MGNDTRDAAGFYATALGRRTVRVLRRKLLALWPDCAGMSILGFGFAGPYLHLWREQAARGIVVTPQNFVPCPWPAGRRNAACMAEEEALPFPDLVFDRVLLVHGLEHANHARRALREAWRVLKDDGRLIVVVPNRRGVWAYAESTPFGQGQPYSEGQLGRMLAGSFFHVERQEAALFAPPLEWRPNLRAFDAWERLGQAFFPQIAGLTLAEASKDVHGVIPARRYSAGRRVLVETRG